MSRGHQNRPAEFLQPVFPVQAAKPVPVAQGVSIGQPLPAEGPVPQPIAPFPLPQAPNPGGMSQATAVADRKPRPVGARPIPVRTGGVPNTAPAARPVPVVAAPIAMPSVGAMDIRVRDDSEEEEREVTEKAVRSAPPWLVSAVVHMAVLILLGILYVARDSERRVEMEVVYAEQEGQQLIDELGIDQLDPPQIEESAVSQDLIPVVDPFAAPPELDLSVDTLAQGLSSEIEAPSIGMALTGREKGAKDALLGAYGGTATTEAAVQLGLEWLARQQDARTGLWSLKGPYSDGAGYENNLAATAMALLAFQGNGNTHKSGKFQRNVERGANALLKMQDRQGNFFKEGVHNHRLYSQGQATIAICELYGMTKDSRFRQPAQKALDYAADAQSPTLGGWRYNPRQESDTSVTGWFVMALQSGLMAGLDVKNSTLDGVRKFLDTVTKDGSLYSYQPHEPATLAMTAEALLCRQYLGWSHDDQRLRVGVDTLLENPVDYADQDVYYWYYATQVLHHMGGDDWDQWNKVMRQRIPEAQLKDGGERGSWDPDGDHWGPHGGRLYTTCLSIYMLEVYYRHLPIYKHANLASAGVSLKAPESNPDAGR